MKDDKAMGENVSSLPTSFFWGDHHGLLAPFYNDFLLLVLKK